MTKIEKDGSIKRIIVMIMGGLLLFFLTQLYLKADDTAVKAEVNKNEICALKEDIKEIKADVKYLVRKANE